MALWPASLFKTDPAAWPERPSAGMQQRLCKRYLRQTGWKIGEPAMWLQVRISAIKDGLWLYLVIQGSHTTSLPLVVKDTVEKNTNRLIVGILTEDYIEPEVAAEAEKYNLFLLRPREFHLVEATMQTAYNAKRASEKALAESLVHLAGVPTA